MKLEEPTFKESLKAAVNNRPFIFGAIIYLFTWVAVGMLQTALLYFVKYVVQQEPLSDVIMGAIFRNRYSRAAVVDLALEET